MTSGQLAAAHVVSSLRASRSLPDLRRVEAFSLAALHSSSVCADAVPAPRSAAVDSRIVKRRRRVVLMFSPSLGLWVNCRPSGSVAYRRGRPTSEPIGILGVDADGAAGDGVGRGCGDTKMAFAVAEGVGVALAPTASVGADSRRGGRLAAGTGGTAGETAGTSRTDGAAAKAVGFAGPVAHTASVNPPAVSTPPATSARRIAARLRVGGVVAAGSGAGVLDTGCAVVPPTS